MYRLNDSVVFGWYSTPAWMRKTWPSWGDTAPLPRLGRSIPRKATACSWTAYRIRWPSGGRNWGRCVPAGRSAACQECHFLGGYSEQESIGECETYLLTSWSNNGLFALLCGQKGIVVDGCTCPRSGAYYCAWCQSLAARAGIALRTEGHRSTDEGREYPKKDGEASIATIDSQRFLSLLPPGAAIGTSLPLRLTNAKSRHEHWTVQSKRTRIQRHYVFEHLMALWEDGPLLGLPLHITITRIAPRVLDEGDNLAYAASAVRDAISDWLCGQYLKGEDRQEGLVWEYEQKRLVPGFYACEITVERPKKASR